MEKDIYILAIETSCDETSIAVMLNGKLCSNVISSQKIHEIYGGVVPELASREHQKAIVPMLEMALIEAKIFKESLSAISYTRGPGLLGSLLVGSSFAKGMALGLGLPLIEVNHLQAHIFSLFIEEPHPEFPFICLLVSGGHTQLYLVTGFLETKLLGETSDDAAGEAFDKSAKILGLPYPGGPMIDKFALTGNPNAFSFPYPLVEGLNFSFSGLKTSFLYFVRDNLKKDIHFIEKNKNDICASIQAIIVKILLDKLIKASEIHQIKTLAITGGVSANSCLRKHFLETGKKMGWNTFIPKIQYCTDNAAMIAKVAHYKFLKKDFSTQDVTPFT